MSEMRPPADQPEPADEAAGASDQPQQSDAEKAAEIADEKEKSGAETVV
jgi:hypothetical protein